MTEAIRTLKDRVKERELIILNYKEDKILVDQKMEKIQADSEITNKEMLKLQMSKTGIIAPKTSVQKITGKLNINDDEFKKTINIIDHWIKVPSPNKSI